MYCTILTVGTLIDRYGGRSGRYAAPLDTPFYQRALPPTTALNTREAYRVVRPIHVTVGHAVPWFGTVGCGLQYQFDATIHELLERGDLELM